MEVAHTSEDEEDHAHDVAAVEVEHADEEGGDRHEAVAVDVGAKCDLFDGEVADASDDCFHYGWSVLVHLVVVSSSMHQRQQSHLCAQSRLTGLQLWLPVALLPDQRTRHLYKAHICCMTCDCSVESSVKNEPRE